METYILNWNQETAEKAREIIQKGELVAFPTETIYGLWADALNEEAVKKNIRCKMKTFFKSINSTYLRERTNSRIGNSRE